MAQDRAPGPRILNLSDDEPSEPQAVTAEAARLLGLPPPPLVPFATAWEQMSPMARTFWAENRRVCSTATKAALGISWRYATYREGFATGLSENGTAPASSTHRS